MSAYCNASDLYSHGLPPGGLPNPGRLLASVSADDDTLTLREHGLTDDDPVSFRAEGGGALPTPLTDGTTYYAIAVSDDVISVTDAPGGEAIDITAAGSRTLLIAPLPIAKAITWGAAMIENMLPAHLVPLIEPYPEIVRMTNAELAVGKLMTRQGASSTSLSEMVAAAQKRLERWGKGVPLRGENVPERANLAVSASAATRNSRGWLDVGVI